MNRHTNRPGDIAAVSACCLIVLFSAPHALGATFVINNNDGPGEGFNDPTPVAPVGGNPGITLGEQRLNMFQRAADIWGGVIESDVPIRVRASFDPLSCSSGSAILGSAGTIEAVRDFQNAPHSNTWYHSALANALAGSDLRPQVDDITATFNSSIDNNNNCLSGTNWYLGFDAGPGVDISLLNVLLHEFGHGLGFSGFVNLSTGRLLMSGPDVFTISTFDNQLGLHWDEMSNGQRRSSANNTGDVVWDGSQVRATAEKVLTSGRDGAGNVRLYAPDPVRIGSSIYHYDTVASPNLLMEPAINADLNGRLDLTDDLMIDIGWRLHDADLDGLPDVVDNCEDVANGHLIPDAGGSSQLDSDDDGIGNICDADFNNNGVVDSNDASVLFGQFGNDSLDPSFEPAVDMNGNGVIDSNDASILFGSFGQQPGPSGFSQ
jgi:hypothetical protein